MSPRASVIILNYAGEALLPPCLAALEAQTFPDFELILVDNASSDRSVEVIESFTRRSPLRVKTVLLRENLGCCGNQKGLDRAEGGLIVLLNNDTRPDPRWLEELVEAADAHPEVGACASKMLVEGTSIIDSAGVGYSTLLKGFNHGEGEEGAKHDDPVLVFGVCTGAALFRRTLLAEMGFHDEDFFLIHDDTDLSFRAQLAGWKVLYVPTAVVHHKVRASIGRMSDLAVYHTLRNSEFVRIKNLPAALFLRFLPEFLAGMLLEFLYFAVKHGRLRLYLRAKRDALKALPRMLEKRRWILAHRKIDDAAIRAVMTPIFQASFVREKAAKFFFQ
ncbi:MAG: glycosyltransferase family 2 protein [Elusimicrobia bacterium]|nr:glycosyltransferase family 2 protein [Elusimicrobiota bacterium]